MLVLSRMLDESIVIGDDIIITVVGIRGDKIRLGVEAPKEVPVHRREVFDAIRNSLNYDNAYREFKSELDSCNFGRSYDLFYKHGGAFGSREEIDRMFYGLNGH